MSDTPITPDDPRLTAYVLGELSDVERETVEAHLATSPACRRAVEELQETSALLDEALQNEPVTALTNAQRHAIHTAATTGSVPRHTSKSMLVSNDNHSEPSRQRAVTTALLTVLAVSVAILLAVLLPVSSQPTTVSVALTVTNGQSQLDVLNLSFPENIDDLTRQRLEHFHLSEPSPDVDPGDEITGVSDPSDQTAKLRYDQARQQVMNAIFRAERMRKDQPHASIEMLDQAIANLEGSGLTQQQVVPLLRSLRGSRASIETWLTQSNSLPDKERHNAETRVLTEAESKARLRIEQKIVTLVNQFNELMDQRRYAEANTIAKQAKELAPENSVVIAMQLKSKFAYRMERNENLRDQREESFWKQLDDSERAAITKLSRNAPISTSTSSVTAGTPLGPAGRHPVIHHSQVISTPSIASTEESRPVSLWSHMSRNLTDMSIGSGHESSAPNSRYSNIVVQRDGITLLEQDHLPAIVSQRIGAEVYTPIVENPFTSPVDAPLSTFGLDVDTASYANVRRFFMDEGRLPPPDAVRIEELVNSFSYDDPQPVDEHPLRVSLESAACPWDESHRLVRIGVKGKEIDLAGRPPTSLVFLIDTSGSMRDDNKLPLVKESLRLLVDEMSENDRIAIVTYSNDAGLVLDSTSGEHRDEIMSVIDSLHANGSTNGEAGLKTAYEVATRHKIDNGANRVILCTDGDFNVGESEDAPLVQMISQRRETGVHLSIFGFGTGNLKDAKLEQIADHGNGHYHYIDGLRQARRVFLDELTGTLYTIAKDVKLQIEFNPAHVGAYRLIGYENRTLAAEDFNNDRIDAGDLGAGHSVCALYEIVPPNALPVQQLNEPNVDPLKYQSSNADDQTSPVTPLAAPQREAPPSDSQPSVDLQTGTDSQSPLSALLDEEKQLLAKYGPKHPAVVSIQLTISKTRRFVLAEQGIQSPDARIASPELLTVKLRYKTALPVGSRLNEAVNDESVKLEFPLVDDPDNQALSNNLNWSAAVASFGMLLRNSAYRGNATFDSVLEMARDAMGDDRSGQRAEFIDMVLKARQLRRQSHGTDSPPPPELSSLEARRKASFDGRYNDLLDKISRPEDFKQYGAFHNRGWWTGPHHADEKGYPAGYWVYVYPHWYVWNETVGADSQPSTRRPNPLRRPPVDSHESQP